jgi:hypothetical protein
MKICQAVHKLLVGDTQTDGHFRMIEVTFNAITTIQNFIQIHQSVQKMPQPQKFRRPQFGKVTATGLNTMELRSCSVSSLPYKSSSKSTSQFKSCTHLRSLNVRHFEIIGATGLNSMESRSCSMSSLPYKISSKSTSQFKSCTHLRSLNVRHFEIVEATGLNSMESRSSSMLSPPDRLVIW